MWEYTHYDELYHHGVKGMRWGVRKAKNKTSRTRGSSKNDDAHADYKRAHSSKSTRSMSDSELRERNNRLQMEKQYKELTKKENKGKKVVSAMLATTATLVTVAKIYSNIQKFKKSDLGKASSKAVDSGLNKVGDKIIRSIDFSGPLTS